MYGNLSPLCFLSHKRGVCEAWGCYHNPCFTEEEIQIISWIWSYSSLLIVLIYFIYLCMQYRCKVYLHCQAPPSRQGKASARMGHGPVSGPSSAGPMGMTMLKGAGAGQCHGHHRARMTAPGLTWGPGTWERLGESWG